VYELVFAGLTWPAEENGKVIVPKMIVYADKAGEEREYFTFIYFPDNLYRIISFEKIEKPLRYSMTTTA
jgi:hypothetical protein